MAGTLSSVALLGVCRDPLRRIERLVGLDRRRGEGDGLIQVGPAIGVALIP